MQAVSRGRFFEHIFGGLQGYLCIARKDPQTGSFNERFFEFPEELNECISYIEKNKPKHDLYFAPFMLIRRRRRKEDIAESTVIWADGDECPIEALVLQPSAIIPTSEGRHSFLWRLDDIHPPDLAEGLSKRVAYYHANDGMDKSGWDLTQLLRVPDTWNHKYEPPQRVGRAVVDLGCVYSPEDFKDEYPPVPDDAAELEVEFEEADIPDKSGEEILDKYKLKVSPRALHLYYNVPMNDWSSKLWELELCCFEAGMEPEEAFKVAQDSACNKYRRDERKPHFLWREILRAQAKVETRKEEPPAIDRDALSFGEPPELLSDAERREAKDDETFIEKYTEWADKLGDAATQYHPAGAFIILSCLLSGDVRLPISIGTLVPNLWVMILADTTLTRKTTAMGNAMDLLKEVEEDIVLATDGSMEGLMTAVAARPNRTSLFLKDEITGLIESMGKKQYMAGMMEALTNLYDGKQVKRVLRSGTINVKNPIFVFFGGGIREKMVELLQYQHVTSGFLPRFVFITAEADMTRMKPLGPPQDNHLGVRGQLVDRLQELYTHYSTGMSSTSGDAIHIPKKWIAELTDDAWVRYNRFEHALVEYARNSADPTLMTPMMDRLAKSGLKAAVLIAAQRKLHEDIVTVTRQDIIHAFWYVERWQLHTHYMISNIGTTKAEAKLKSVLNQVRANPGVLRSVVMQRNFLSAREADTVFNTLEQRGQITRKNRGAYGERIHPVESITEIQT